jgi:branched-chain amino acid transport system substrate-binding protein
MKSITRPAIVASVALLTIVGLAACTSAAPSAAPTSTRKSTLYFGVSAAETGPYAQYGAQFKEAFTLAADQVNAKGGVNGHPVTLKYEDSQSDPKQSVTVAQDFVQDSSIKLVFGDYASSASIPASPIYTAGKLLQYGFNNSNPDFTALGSEYQWSTSVTTNESYTWTADYIKKQGVKSIGVTYLNSADWGIPAYQAFKTEAKKIGLKITDAEAVDPTATDFRPSLIKAVADKPQAFVHIGYGPDAAEVVSQLRAIGYQGKFYGGQDVQVFDQSPTAQGSIEGTEFLASNPNKEVQSFTRAFLAKYPAETEVTGFEAGAYDALNVAVAAARIGGTSRAGILKGFQELKNVPSVVYGEITFDKKTRLPAAPQLTPTVLKKQEWVQIGA